MTDQLLNAITTPYEYYRLILKVLLIFLYHLCVFFYSPQPNDLLTHLTLPRFPPFSLIVTSADALISDRASRY